MSAAEPARRWAWAEIDLDAIEHNVAHLVALARPAQLWAVVKADGYGHGATEVAAAALAAGASALCVALTQEGVALREAGIDAPVLVLSQQPPEQLGALVAAGLTPVVYTVEGVRALAVAVGRSSTAAVADAVPVDRAVATGAAVAVPAPVPMPVHVKVDTGMHRVGAAPVDLPAVLAAVQDEPGLVLGGMMTHLAVADEPERHGTAEQLVRFDAAIAAVHEHVGPDVVLHAANSAGLLAHPAARYGAVRAGIAIYGIAPGPALAAASTRLRPALSLVARVSHVQRLDAGESISYGWRHTFASASTVATVPLGYADGVPRRLSSCGGEVLVGGRRRRIVGVVTMDQLMVDCADDEVAVGDEVVLIGRQGDEIVTAHEWAHLLGTIPYEVVCGIGARVPRVHVRRPSGGGRHAAVR